MSLPAWDDASARLKTYIDVLLKQAAARSLISRSQRSASAIWEHVFDSLHALYLIEPDSVGPIMDLGSGNGLPGLPLALSQPKRQFILADRSSSKAEFLEYAVAQLRLTNVRVVCAELGPGLLAQEKPQLVLMRALQGPEYAPVFASLGRAATRWLVFGTMDNVEHWAKASHEAGLELLQVLPYRLSEKIVDRVLLKFSHSKK